MSSPFGTTFAHNPIKGFTVARVHYSASPKKTPEWAAKTRATYQTPTLWEQDQEIKFDAFSGQLVYPEFIKEFTVVEPQPIPDDVTFYMGIDPHPRTPHACLWMYVDRWDNHTYIRDFWPSRSYGVRGPVPEDDQLYQIPQYAETIKWMEGESPDMFAPNGYTDNHGRRQEQYRRIGDYSAKGWASNRELGKDEAVTFWETYRNEGIYLEEAKKEFHAGRDIVGSRLVPRTYMSPEGEKKQSQILIFNTCKELVLELECARYPQLTPGQIDKRDPIETPMSKRDHITDLLRYLENSDLVWVNPIKKPEREMGTPYPDIPGFQV